MPIRYDRELWEKTVRVMKRVQQIRDKRSVSSTSVAMAGNRARELAAARKLVAENEHLLPRLRGSEKRRLAELAAERGVDVEDLEQEELATKRGTKKSKVFGGEVRRLGVRTDGGVEEVSELVGGQIDEDGEDDEDDEDDDDMDMD